MLTMPACILFAPTSDISYHLEKVFGFLIGTCCYIDSVYFCFCCFATHVFLFLMPASPQGDYAQGSYNALSDCIMFLYNINSFRL